MHSRIFQITQTRVEKENYLNEDTLMQGDNSHFDYCAEIDDEERKENIEYLVNHILPKDRVTRHKSGWLYLILARAAPVSFIAMSCRTSVAGFFAFLPVPYPRSNGMTPLLLVPALQVVSTGGILYATALFQRNTATLSLRPLIRHNLQSDNGKY